MATSPGPARSASPTPSNCRCRSTRARPISAPRSRVGRQPRLGARRLRRIVLPQRHQHARLGQPAARSPTRRRSVRCRAGCRSGPNSNLNTGNVSGALNLPARSHATAYVSVGNWSQDDPLIPFTINSALPVIPLDRADGRRAARASRRMNYTFNSRPTDHRVVHRPLPLVRLRQPDARLPRHEHGGLRHDRRGVCRRRHEPVQPQPQDVRRRGVADADLHYAAFRAGYTREHVDQTFRTFDTTTENTRAAVGRHVPASAG